MTVVHDDTTTDLAPWQLRLLEEREALYEKVFKLKDSMLRPAFMAVEYSQRQLLTAQCRTMERYLYYLDLRLSEFLPEYTPTNT